MDNYGTFLSQTQTGFIPMDSQELCKSAIDDLEGVILDVEPGDIFIILGGEPCIGPRIFVPILAYPMETAVRIIPWLKQHYSTMYFVDTTRPESSHVRIGGYYKLGEHNGHR